MSLHLEFEPHSWYMHFAIKDNRASDHDQAKLERPLELGAGYRWSAYTDDGHSGFIVERHADTLRELKQYIKEYRQAYAEKMARLYS